MLQFQAFCLKLRANLHFIYLLYAIPLVCIAIVMTPPFQNPDEPNHFARAEQVSRLELVPVFKYDADRSIHKSDSISTDKTIIYPEKGGFKVDKGIYTADDFYEPIKHHEKVKVSAEATNKAMQVRWGSGYVYLNFANTAIYTPVVYIMPAIGVKIGKLFNMPIVQTLYLARVLNAIVSISLCFWALMLAKRSGMLMFIFLLFPMAVSMFASVSQDAILISCAFLLIGIIDSAEFGAKKKHTKWQLLIMILLVSIISVAKPPYIIFAGIFLFLKLPLKTKSIAILMPLLLTLSWIFINSGSFAIHFAPPELHVNVKLQVVHIINHPFKFIGMFFQYDGEAINNFFRMIVGVLGWLELQFNADYYHIAYFVMAAGIFVCCKFKTGDNILIKTGLLAVALATFIAVLTAQYVTWTPLYSQTLGGMQGRYFLPIVPFIALGLSSSLKQIKWDKLKDVLFFIILVFPLYSIITLIHTLHWRYY